MGVHNKDSIDIIKKNLIIEIEKLINIIKKEYKGLVDVPSDYDLNKVVHIEDTGTISLYVENQNFYFPKDAISVLKIIRKIPGYGINRNHNTHPNYNTVINDNTYITYSKHVFLKGLTPEEYFKEILLHETMHFCGSDGMTALREGINELKTRQLALKYGLLTSYCGYPKETKIALELEKLWGPDIINKIAFSKNDNEIREILNSISPEATNLFFALQATMEKEFYNKYMKHGFPGILGPLKKVIKYYSLNYTDAYKLIEQYKKDNNRKKMIHLQEKEDSSTKLEERKYYYKGPSNEIYKYSTEQEELTSKKNRSK